MLAIARAETARRLGETSRATSLAGTRWRGHGSLAAVSGHAPARMSNRMFRYLGAVTLSASAILPLAAAQPPTRWTGEALVFPRSPTDSSRRACRIDSPDGKPWKLVHGTSVLGLLPMHVYVLRDGATVEIRSEREVRTHGVYVQPGNCHLGRPTRRVPGRSEPQPPSGSRLFWGENAR